MIDEEIEKAVVGVYSRDENGEHGNREEDDMANINRIRQTPPCFPIIITADNGKGDSSRTWRAYPSTPLESFGSQ